VSTSRKDRLRSVDFLRGLAIALMILANNPGDVRLAYAPLRHAVWNGCTLADAVFPMFLFLVGVCVPLAVRREARGPGQAAAFWNKVLRRTIVLFLLGLAENALIRWGFQDLRLPGVLQRIAVVYLAAVWLHVRLGDRGLVATGAAILLGYWLLLLLTPVPGLGHPSIDAAANLQGWLDTLVFGSHIWKHGTTWDPEGILSTFPAVALGLLGVLAGRWLQAGHSRPGRVMLWGVGLTMTGWIWSFRFPLNKSLCTSSFVLFVGGAGILLLAACAWLMDDRGLWRWGKPLLTMGQNPLVLYLAASFLASILRHVTVATAAGRIPLQAALYRLLFAGWLTGKPASLAWGLALLALIWLGARALEVRHIVIKL